MMHLLTSVRRTLTYAFCLLALGAAAFAAEPAVKTFDIPAGPASRTLKQFAAQSGREIVFAPLAVAKITTQPVKGKVAPAAALDSMLTDTGLIATQDQKTGAFAVRKGDDPNAARAAQTAKASDRPESKETQNEPLVVLDDYQVTGSRLRLNSGELPAQPVLTMTALDIERLGASSLAQLFQYIPSVTSSTTGLNLENANAMPGIAGVVDQSGTRTSAQLRGGIESATLLLVDGKRVPRTGQRNAGGVGFDLGGIPLSAVERVEVLLDGASAIYGNDAINGVINVILKKSYVGTEIHLNYDNTFDKDAAVRTASLTHGFARGRWSGLVTLSASDNNIMLLTDRRLTESYDRTLLGGTVNSSGTRPAEGNGSLGVNSGVLPGLGTQYVAIPTSGAGANLTFAAFANMPPVTRFGSSPEDRGAMSLNRSQSTYARLAFEFSSQLELSATVRYGQSETWDHGVYRTATNLTLPAGYPGNPFGVPVRLNKVFYDLPKLVTGYDVENGEVGFSAKGKLPGDWRYEASLNYVRGRNDQQPARLAGAGNQVAASNLNTAALNAAMAAGRRPMLVYNSLTQSPVSATELDELWVNQNPFVLSDLSQTWTYAAQADGPMFTLPAGAVRAVAGLEYREEYFDTPDAISSSVWNPYPARKVQAAFAEVRLPLVSPKQRWPLVRQLDLNLAVRSEEYSDITGGRVLTPRYGAAWRPIDALLLRGSYGEGFLVPNLYNTLPVRTATTTTIPNTASWVDPQRGNTIAVGQSYLNYGGGNADLKPQTSRNWTYGAVWEVPKVKGLSLSFDYFENRYENRFGNISLLSDRIIYAPETIVRGPKLPGDPTGWAGPIVSVDQRVINIAEAHVAGYNFGVRWHHHTPWGEFSLSSAGEKILVNEQKIVPNAVPQDSVNKRFNPMRITNSLYWSRGPWDAGVTSIYGGRAWAETTNPALAASRWTDCVLRFDLNASYDFGERRGFGGRDAAWWQRMLRDTKWGITIINVADTEPPLDVLGFFDASIIDLRLRRYVIDVTKRF